MASTTSITAMLSSSASSDLICAVGLQYIVLFVIVTRFGKAFSVSSSSTGPGAILPAICVVLPVFRLSLGGLLLRPDSSG